MSKHEWKVGDAVVLVRRSRGRGTEIPETVTITKVAKRWIYYGEGWRSGRFDAVDCHIDGEKYSSPGRVWRTEDEWRENMAREKAFTSLRLKMPYQPECGVTLADITEAARLLRVPIAQAPDA